MTREVIALTPGRADIEAWQGDLFLLHLTRASEDANGNLTPVDITGYTIEMRVARHAGQTAVVEGLYIADDEPNGAFYMRIEPEDMALLDGSYVYDMEMSGETFMWGSFYVHTQVLAEAAP